MSLTQIEKEIIINSKNIKWQTPLIIACKNGHLEIVEELINNNALLNIKDIKGYNALFHAVNKGHISVIKYLIKTNIDINSLNNNAHNILYFASSLLIEESIQLEILEILLDSNIKNLINIPCFNNWTPIMIGANNGRLLICKKLLEFNADVNMIHGGGNNAFLIAIQENNIDIVNLMKPYCNDIGQKDNIGNNVLHYACNHNNIDFIKDLLK